MDRGVLGRAPAIDRSRRKPIEDLAGGHRITPRFTGIGDLEDLRHELGNAVGTIAFLRGPPQLYSLHDREGDQQQCSHSREHHHNGAAARTAWPRPGRPARRRRPPPGRTARSPYRWRGPGRGPPGASRRGPPDGRGASSARSLAVSPGWPGRQPSPRAHAPRAGPARDDLGAAAAAAAALGSLVLRVHHDVPRCRRRCRTRPRPPGSPGSARRPPRSRRPCRARCPAPARAPPVLARHQADRVVVHPDRDPGEAAPAAGRGAGTTATPAC